MNNTEQKLDDLQNEYIFHLEKIIIDNNIQDLQFEFLKKIKDKWVYECMLDKVNNLKVEVNND